MNKLKEIAVAVDSSSSRDGERWGYASASGNGGTRLARDRLLGGRRVSKR